MDTGRNSLSWAGYPGWTSTQAPPSSRNASGGFKRARSDTEDGDDVFSDQSSKDRCSSPGEAESCQMKSRKKRRGIIEKRRRDRINSSLGELRRLVPTAYEKQGSAKLEKAEILQMTVDHLKMLHARGSNQLAYDTGKFAMDYHNIGFQECVAEVSKYLAIEGLDINNSLCMRLMSHLHNVTAQRQLVSKQSPWHTAAVSSNPSQPYQSPSSLHLPRPPPPPPPVQGLTSLHNTSLDSSGTSLELNSSNSHSINSSFETSGSSGSCEPPPPPSTTQSSSPSTANSTIHPLTTITSSSDGYGYLHHHGMQQHTMELYQHSHMHPSNPYGQGQTDPSAGSQMKQPYRPWGAEVAY